MDNPLLAKIASYWNVIAYQSVLFQKKLALLDVFIEVAPTHELHSDWKSPHPTNQVG